MSVKRVIDDLEQPVIDDHSYHVICLPNKLEMLLIHNLNTNKASTFMNVEVGNFFNNSNMPGMVHAVKHLSFIGPEKISETFLLNSMMEFTIF